MIRNYKSVYVDAIDMHDADAKVDLLDKKGIKFCWHIYHSPSSVGAINYRGTLNVRDINKPSPYVEIIFDDDKEMLAAKLCLQ